MRKIKRYIGCDPGKTGCVAMIPSMGEVELYPLEEETLITLLEKWKDDDCFCVLEHVTSSPQMGVTSSFTFGEGFGFIKGALSAFKIPFQLVKPTIWKRNFGCLLGKDASSKEKKERDYVVARNLFPTVDFRKTERCKTVWFDAADALLLAEYGRRLRQ